jgi:hypothetical protein
MGQTTEALTPLLPAITPRMHGHPFLVIVTTGSRKRGGPLPRSFNGDTSKLLTVLRYAHEIITLAFYAARDSTTPPPLNVWVKNGNS